MRIPPNCPSPLPLQQQAQQLPHGVSDSKKTLTKRRTPLSTQPITIAQVLQPRPPRAHNIVSITSSSIGYNPFSLTQPNAQIPLAVDPRDQKDQPAKTTSATAVTTSRKCKRETPSHSNGQVKTESKKERSAKRLRRPNASPPNNDIAESLVNQSGRTKAPEPSDRTISISDATPRLSQEASTPFATESTPNLSNFILTPEPFHLDTEFLHSPNPIKNGSKIWPPISIEAAQEYIYSPKPEKTKWHCLLASDKATAHNAVKKDSSAESVTNALPNQIGEKDYYATNNPTCSYLPKKAFHELKLRYEKSLNILEAKIKKTYRTLHSDTDLRAIELLAAMTDIRETACSIDEKYPNQLVYASSTFQEVTPIEMKPTWQELQFKKNTIIGYLQKLNELFAEKASSSKFLGQLQLAENS